MDTEFTLAGSGGGGGGLGLGLFGGGLELLTTVTELKCRISVLLELALTVTDFVPVPAGIQLKACAVLESATVVSLCMLLQPVMFRDKVLVKFVPLTVKVLLCPSMAEVGLKPVISGDGGPGFGVLPEPI